MPLVPLTFIVRVFDFRVKSLLTFLLRNALVCVLKSANIVISLYLISFSTTFVCDLIALGSAGSHCHSVWLTQCTDCEMQARSSNLMLSKSVSHALVKAIEISTELCR